MMKVLYSWHSQRMDIAEIKDGICPTVPAALGMGGQTRTHHY